MKKRNDFVVTFPKMPDGSTHKLEFQNSGLGAHALAHAIVSFLGNSCLVHNVQLSGYPLKEHHFSDPIVFHFLKDEIVESYRRHETVMRAHEKVLSQAG